MANDWVDYTAVKEAVSMEMALAHYQIELRKVNAFTLRGRCHLPTHVGESGNSFSINTAKGSGGAWSCLATSCMAQRDGRKGGNVLDFVAAMESCSVRDAALRLQEWFSLEASNERPSDYVPPRERQNKPELAAKEKSGGMVGQRQTRPNTEKKNEPLDFELKGIDPTHPYFQKRGISQETAAHFGAAFFLVRVQ